MSSPCKRRKRGPYKAYLSPTAEFQLPRSTARARYHHAGASYTGLSSEDEDRPWEEDATAEYGTSKVLAFNDTVSTQARGADCDAAAQAGSEPAPEDDSDDAEMPEEQAVNEPPFEHDIEEETTSECGDQPEETMAPATAPSSHVTPSVPEQDDKEPVPGGNSLFSQLFEEHVNEKVVVSKGDVLLMVLKYALKNSLSLTGLTSLIDMINHFFERPVLPHSQYKVTQMLEESGMSMNFHFFCPKCFKQISHVEAKSSFKCPGCSSVTSVSTLAEIPFFVILNVESQLQKLLRSCELLDLTKSLPQDCTFSDIWDGQLYRNFVARTKDAGPRISFSLNADGTPLFKSSGTAIWPIQLIINEVPPEQRMTKLVLAALWFGKEKPDMALFQGAFVDAMNCLSNEGFILERQGKTEKFKAFCVCCAVDSVARAPMQGVTQFNGHFGCNWCLQEGEWAGGSMRYPVQSNDPPERTEKQMLIDMEIAEKEKKTIHGVKTISPLIGLPHFNIVWSFVPDYMHCILLGIGRQFLDMWFDSANCPHSISREQLRVDQRLMAIQPPKIVRRMPRPTKERRWWKAKELENWVLFYSIPVLDGILPKTCLQHWACLVEALHIMLKRSIKSSELDVAEELLIEFHVRAEVLYGKAFMTFNMHQLTHIVKSIHHWGPLWAHSAFPFESGNGNLKEAVKAANGIPHQVCRLLQMEDVVQELTQLADDERVLNYCTSLDASVTQKSICCSDGIYFFGKGTAYEQPSCEVGDRYSVPLNSRQYSRMLINRTILTDSSYSKTKKTNSSVVQLPNGSFAILQKLLYGSDDKAYVLLRQLKCTPVKYSLVTMRHLLKVIGEEPDMLVLLASEIQRVCVLMEVHNTYVAAAPSSFTF